LTETLNENDYREIGNYITDLVNPEQELGAKIIWNGKKQQYVIQHNESTTITLLPSTQTLEKMITTFQIVLHELAKEKKRNCFASFCECKYDSPIIRKYDLFEEFLSYIQNSIPMVTKNQLQETIITKNTTKAITSKPFDNLLLEELQRMYHQLLKKQIGILLFKPHPLQQCKKNQHKESKGVVIWKSKSKLLINKAESASMRELLEKQKELTKYQIISVQCQICGSKGFIPQSARITIPSVPFQKSRIEYQPLSEKPFSEVWQALQNIYEVAFPTGQARVLAKTHYKIPLSSTDRTIKHQLKIKMIKLRKQLEMWEDLSREFV
jgi:hypothetical protein